MLKGQDILVLAALLADRESPTLPSLAEASSLALGPVHRSLARLGEAGLVTRERRVRLAQADEFLLHGLRYVFPARMTGETRGIPTSWAASPLQSLLASTDGAPPVWPHPSGEVRGIGFEPIHRAAPEAALRDAEIYELLAVIDALRAGDARLRDLAHDELRRRFSNAARR
jgi:hypothetical protein